MKRRIINVFCILTVLVIFVFSFISCGGDSKTAVSISVNFDETVQIYENTSLDELKNSLTVEVFYSDETSEEINDYTLSGVLIKGESTVIVKYGNFKKSFTVNVLEGNAHTHSLVDYEAKSATCTAVGWEAYVECSDCGYSTYTEIKALGHNYVNGICSRCEIPVESVGLKFEAKNDYKKTCHVTVIGTCTDTYIVIPAKAPNGYDVVGIWESAFRDCRNITNVYLHENIEYIGSQAFMGCTSLKDLTISEGVKRISGSAFRECSSLTSLTVPDSVEFIDEWAFSDCTGLKTVTIGDGVALIDDFAFMGCRGLESLSIGNGVKEIGMHAFSMCSRLYELTIPDNVNTINEHAFEYCISLTSLKIGRAGRRIHENAFSECHKLVEVIDMSGFEKDFWGVYPLEKHTGETKIVNQNGYLFITYANVNYLLGYVGADTELSLPENYNGEKYEIYKYAFYNRNDITSVRISDGVVKIGERAFSYCTNLVSVVFENTTGWFISKDLSATSDIYVNVTDAEQNAEYLVSIYDSYYWKRSEN